MKLSTKFTILILTTALFATFASPAWANPCTILAFEAYRDTTTGAAYYSFTGSCPAGFQHNYSVFVGSDPDSPYHGSGASIFEQGGPYNVGTSHTVEAYCRSDTGITDGCNTSFTVSAAGTCTDNCTSDGDCAAGEICDRSCDPNGVVGDCVSGPLPPGPSPCSGGEISTGLGCIPTDPADLILRILEIAIGVAGGIALLSVIFGGFTVLTSSGNPDKIQEGKGMITSAIAGLALILFSVVILNIIGFNILGIPFFNP